MKMNILTMYQVVLSKGRESTYAEKLSNKQKKLEMSGSKKLRQLSELGMIAREKLIDIMILVDLLIPQVERAS